MFKLLLLLFTITSLHAEMGNDNPSEMGRFSGRISRIQKEAELIRLRVDFTNMKYLNKKDVLEFWDERDLGAKCKAYVVGKSSQYLLIKVQNYKECQYHVFMGEGAYIDAYSEDLKNNIKMGRELVKVLLKKRLAIHSKYTDAKKDLDIHIEKVNAVNLRFETLRKKLETQWRNELADLEEDRIANYKKFKGVESKLLDLDHKLEKYRVEDRNMKQDRWSLDSSLYFKK